MKDLRFFTDGLRPYAFLIAMLAILSSPGVFNMPVLDRDEARFTQATAQMLETGDYVVIRYHEGLRNKKPVGIHWLQAASVGALADVENRQIWAWRLPSLLGAMLTVCALFWAGSAMFSRSAAFAGAVLAGCTLLISSEAHIAKTDAALVGFITLTLAVLAHLRKADFAKHALASGGAARKTSESDKDSASAERKRLLKVTAGEKALGLLFWFALGWGILIKGPIAPMVVALTIALLLVWERRAGWLRALAFWPGPLIAALIVIPWFIAVQIATEGAFLNEAVGVDLGPKMVSGAEGHSAPPGYHLSFLPFLFWPSTLFLIPGIAFAAERLFRRKVGEPPADMAGWRFLIAWAVPAFIVFEITPTKLAHYPMPTYPALALMAGVALDRLMDYKAEKRAPHWPRWISFALFLVTSIAVLAIMSPWGLAALRAEGASDFGADALRAATDWQAAWRADGAPLWPFLLAGLAIGGVIWTFLEKRYAACLAALVVTSLAAGGGLRGVILPNQDWVLASEAAVELLDEVCGAPEGYLRDTDCTQTPPRRIRAIDYAEPSFVFMLGGRIDLPPKTTADIPPRSQDPRPVWIIDIASENGKLALDSIISQAAETERCVRIARRLVRNYSNNDAHELAAVVVEPGLCVPDSGA